MAARRCPCPFEAPNFAHIATLLPDGGPHSVPVWVGIEDGMIAFLTSPGSRKARNLTGDPRVAISVSDRNQPYAMALVGGRVTARLAAASLAPGDPTGWFDRLYAAGAAGRVPLRGAAASPTGCSPNGRSATTWPTRGSGAIVPGCGLGADAEYLARLGFATTAFA